MTASDTTGSDLGGHMSIWEHIAELRSRLIKVILAVIIGGFAGWFLYPYVLNFLQQPFCEVQTDCQFIATEPLQAFGLRIKMSAYIGVAAAMPVILWQVWRFITPGLHSHEKKYAIPFMVSALSLFALGAFVAYITLNPTLQFLTSIGGGDITPFYTAESYVTLTIWMMLAFGVGFEFPVVLVALQMMKVITPRQLLGWWRIAVVVIALTAAIITPSGDPISMFALGVPMTVLYILSIGVGAGILKIRGRRSRRVQS